MTDYCVRCLYEDYDGAEEPCINCVRDEDEYPTEYFPKRPPKPVTNADRIRAMTDEELAATEMLCPYWASKNPWRCPEKYAKRTDGKEGYDCVACVLDWLKATVEEVED